MSAYLLRGASLGLAWLLLVNAVATIAVVALERRAASPRPGLWLALRLFPAAASTAFVLLVFAPSFWQYEPRDPGEAIDMTLAICAAAGGALLAIGAARGAAAWRAASRRTTAWARLSSPLALDGTTLPVFAVDSPVPVMALAGVFRPRLLITRGVLDALTAEELRAGVAHEVGHWRARDNLKRLAMRAAPDFLWCTPAAGALEARWASAAEHAADRDACDDEHARCALASALVKIARLTPRTTPLAEPISTLVDGGEIASRVERLLSGAASRPQPSRRWTIAAIAIAALAATEYVPLLQLVHEATEVLVRSLP